MSVLKTPAELQEHFIQLIDVLRSTYVTDHTDIAAMNTAAIQAGKRYMVTTSGLLAGVIFWVGSPGTTPYRSGLICNADGSLGVQNESGVADVDVRR